MSGSCLTPPFLVPQEKGVALNWGTCVAAISICTANKDSRTASK